MNDKGRDLLVVEISDRLLKIHQQDTDEYEKINAAYNFGVMIGHRQAVRSILKEAEKEGK